MVGSRLKEEGRAYWPLPCTTMGWRRANFLFLLGHGTSCQGGLAVCQLRHATPPPFLGCRGGPKAWHKGLGSCQGGCLEWAIPFPCLVGANKLGLAEGPYDWYLGLVLKGQPASPGGPTSTMALVGPCQSHQQACHTRGYFFIQRATFVAIKGGKALPRVLFLQDFIFFQIFFLVVVEDIEQLLSVVWIILIVFYEGENLICILSFVCCFHCTPLWKLFLQKQLDSSNDHEIFIASTQPTRVEDEPFPVLQLLEKNCSYDDLNEFFSFF